MKDKKQFTWLRNQFRFSIQEIAFAGIISGLWIISDKFLTIDFGIMKAGIVYVWAILLGLTTKPTLGVLTAVISDTLTTLIWKGMETWMWEYAIIYPLIVLTTSFFKYSFRIKNKCVWWSTMALINSVAIIGAVFIAIYKNDFIKTGSSEAAFDFTTKASKIIVWSCVTIMILFFVALSFVAYKFEKYKNYLGIYSLAALTIVLFIWVWGPIAQIRYLTRLYGSQKSGESYWKLYDVYFIARVLKTPIVLPIYTVIISSVYIAYNEVQKHSSIKNKW